MQVWDHTWAPSDQWVCTDQSQRSGMGLQTNWNFQQTNRKFTVVYTLLKKHAFVVLKCQKNGSSDQSEMTQDQSWPHGAHVCPRWIKSRMIYIGRSSQNRILWDTSTWSFIGSKRLCSHILTCSIGRIIRRCTYPLYLQTSWVGYMKWKEDPQKK